MESQPKSLLIQLLSLYPNALTKASLGNGKETVTTSAVAQTLRSRIPTDEGSPPPSDKTQKQTSKESQFFGDYYRARFKESEKILKKSDSRESGSMNFTARLKESTAMDSASGGNPQGKRFRVTLLQEGLGNFGDCYYYTKEAIGMTAPLFEGAHFFADHPSTSEEQDRPERSVRDVIGYFENVIAESDESGRLCLNGDAVLVNGNYTEQFRALMKESLTYSLKHQNKDLVGLSINAAGDFDVVALDQFMKDETIPEPCQMKLMEALQQGITMIRPVREMTSAVSCDLVTTAGAGGTINQILEGEKPVMKKEAQQEEHKEKGKEAEEKKEAGIGADGADGDANGKTGKHDDEEQDKELIMSMLKKYVGDGFSDDDKSMAKEAYQNALEMGMEGKDAETCAGHNMKMAKHLQMKQAKMKQDESDAGGVGDGKAIHDKPHAGPDAAKPAHKDQEEESGKEAEEDESGKMKQSAKAGLSKQVITLTAENAKLRAENEGLKLKDFTDKVLRESRLPMSATKKFRECIKNLKTQKEITESLAIFKEAYSLSGEADGSGFILSVEKTDGNSETSKGFSDCVDN